VAKIKEQRQDIRIRQQGQSNAQYLQEEISGLGITMSDQLYGIKITTLINAADKVADDLDYLCSLIERPDVEFPITDAVVYARAVIALTAQLDYISEDLAENELNEEEDCVTLSQTEVMTLHSHTEGSEFALKILEDICGISLKSN